MRIVSVTLLLATVACDPGADFYVVGARDGRVAWGRGADSVVAFVHAHAFTIDLTTAIDVIASSASELELDSTTVTIYDRAGQRVPVERSWNDCYRSPGEWDQRCATARANLHSTSYGHLDSMTVRFGYAVFRGQRIPLTTVFRKVP